MSKEINPFDWQPYNPSWQQRYRRRQTISRVVYSVIGAFLAIGLVTMPMWAFLL